MTPIQPSLESLVRAIQESQEYCDFLEAKREIEKDPKKLQMANEYRARNYQLQTSENQINLFDEMEKFEQEYAQYVQDKDVEYYLQAEMQLCSMIKEIDKAIVESLEIDVEFLM